MRGERGEGEGSTSSLLLFAVGRAHQHDASYSGMYAFLLYFISPCFVLCCIVLCYFINDIMFNGRDSC